MQPAGSLIGSRNTSRSSHFGRLRSLSQPRELDFQIYIRQTETLYPPWWTRRGATEWFRSLPDDHLWNWYICACVLLGVMWTLVQLEGIYITFIDAVYNVSYAVHMFAIGYFYITEMKHTRITSWTVFSFLVDIATFSHYAESIHPNFKLGVYYVRFHRPFRYLWTMNDYNLKGSILGTATKYCYIFTVLRLTWAYVWQRIDMIKAAYYNVPKVVSSDEMDALKRDVSKNPVHEYLASFYIISKMFIPMGPSIYPDNDVERIVCVCIMMSGCLIVIGAAVASLSLIISIYMRPEETFRSRYRLMMKEMSDTNVPANLRAKVKTFYKMYWHRQRGVSETQLLPTFPPTLPAAIYLDIYFAATQKARILRDLSIQMLSELAQKMTTIHFIPGDAIIQRGSKKCKIIYITYGDVEMLTAEDDNTAILRLTRGTVLTPCGGAVAPALTASHLAVRAATFCTAHVLKASELWRVVYKHSVLQDHAGPILASFTDHVERVKRHYSLKKPDEAVRKSSILQFNRNLMSLKGMKDENGIPLLASSDIFLEIAGCYIMRNRPDATLTDQSDEICLRASFPCILQPNSSLLVAWNAFVAFLILLCCIAHPYNLVFAKERSLGFRFFDFAVTVVFILDLIVYLSTGANVEEGVPITFTQTSSQQMRSHWFVLDVVATLPIFEFIGDGRFGGMNKLLRLPKLFRVLKSFEESCVYRGNVLRFLSYTLLLLIACYLVAAMQQGFMCFRAGYCLVTNFTHSPFWDHKPLDSETIDDRLTFGLYWAISMITFTNHRQTWGATDWRHVMYTLLILEMCVVLRIFMEAVYSATIMVTTSLRENYDSRIATVKNFLIRNEVDPLLMKRFIAYLQLCWHTDKAYRMTHKKHSSIFYDLPEHVYQNIVGRNRSMYILAVPFLRMVNKEDLKAVTSSVKLFYSSPNEILLNTGELTNEIYVIKQGICEILDPTSRKAIGTLSSKNHFGALICLLRLPAYYTIRAVTHVQVMCIPRKALAKALADPQIIQAMNYVKKTPEFQRLQTPVPSFVKYVLPPPTSNLMHFRLPRKHEPDSEFQDPFNKLEFLSILRSMTMLPSYVFPRYTIRPDGNYLLHYEWLHLTSALCAAQPFPFLYYVTLLRDLSTYFMMVLPNSYVFPRYTIPPDGNYLLRYEWFRLICALCSTQLFSFLYSITLLLNQSAYFMMVLPNSYVFPRYTIRPDGNYLLRYEWFRLICALYSTQLFSFLYSITLLLDLSAYFMMVVPNSYVFPRYTIRPDGNYLLRYEWFRLICALYSTQLFSFLYSITLLLDLSAYFIMVLPNSYVFPRYTIRPDGNYLLRYEWFRLTCALCSAQLFPHYTYLVLQWPFLYYVTLLLDLSAYFDIFQRMLIGYFNDDGILVYHPFSTASYYIKGGFITDLLGCLPLENLQSTRMDYHEDKIRVTPTKQFLMLNRLIQMYRMPGAMDVLKDYIERRDILMVIQAIPLFMAMLNIVTCFMVFYSVKIYYSQTDAGYTWHIEPFQDDGGSWMHLFKDTFRFNLTSSPWNMHLATYFWAVYECSSTGYGVFNPSNRDLMQVLFIGMASSAMLATYYSVRIISIRANVNKSLAGFKQHMKDIKVYMAREKLDSELQKELRRYYEYNWEKMGGIDYRGVLKLCDQITLRTDAILHIYGPTFAKCPILADADVSLLRIIGRAVHSVYFLRDMTIMEHNDMVAHMYFVDYGGVEVSVAQGDMSSVLRLPRGSVFGNLEGTPAHRSPYTVVATSRLHLLMIKSEAFSTVTKDFPAVKELLINARMGSKGMRMYILGSEATVVKMRRDARTVSQPQTKSSMLKYIYFQDGLVQFYLIGICMSCIYLDLYNAGYEDNSMWMLTTLYSLDFSFLMKILSQHALPFLVTNKSLKRIMLPIRRLYFKGEFRYDLLSILPLELFSFSMRAENKWMWFGLLRLNRTFRIVTVYKCLRMRNESITVNLTLTTGMAVFIWFTLFVHTSTCIWYFIATVEDSLQPNSSWIYLDDGKTHCDNYYICSLYFVITTFTQNGVGDIMPKKHSEVLFVAMLMIVSTMVFMIYVGEFSNIIQYQSYRSFSFYSKFLELQAFLRNNRVSHNLVTIVNKYTLHLWRENRGLQMPKFLNSAPLSLRLRVMSAAYLHHINRHHIFEDCEPAFLRQLVGCLKLYTYNEGMYVVKENEITDSMYVIHTGKVLETCEDELRNSSIVYPAGSYFGILQGLLRNTPYTHSYRTIIKSQVLTLKLEDWEYLLQHFPSSRDTIHKHMGKLGDNDKNWPGGPPTAQPASAAQPAHKFEAPLEAQEAAPGPSLHSAKVSKPDADATNVTSPYKENQPESPPISRIQSIEEERGADQLAIGGKRKLSIFVHIASIAKKLMGRVSDPDLENPDGKDELLLEEDFEATEALLAQFEKARRKEMEEKRLRSERKLFFSQEKATEKYMFMKELTEQSEEIGSEAFKLQPLQIHDDEEKEQKHTVEPKVKRAESEIDLTVDLSHLQIEDEPKKPAKLVPLTSSNQLFSLSEIQKTQPTQVVGGHSAIDISPSKLFYTASGSVRDPQSTNIIDSQPAKDVADTPLDNVKEPEAETSVGALKTIKIHSESEISQSEMGLVKSVNDEKIEMGKPRAETPTDSHSPGTSLIKRTERTSSISSTAKQKTSIDLTEKHITPVATHSKYDDILLTTMLPPADTDPEFSKRAALKDDSSGSGKPYVHVRYEDEKNEANERDDKRKEAEEGDDVKLKPARVLTLDSDEPEFTSVTEPKEGEADSPSTSAAGTSKKDKKPYKRETMD